MCVSGRVGVLCPRRGKDTGDDATAPTRYDMTAKIQRRHAQTIQIKKAAQWDGLLCK